MFFIWQDIAASNTVIAFFDRHMLNVTWEHRDLSFNAQGYLTNPSMVIIALDRERLWDKVRYNFDFHDH